MKLFSDTSRIITTTAYAVTIICGLVGNGLGISLALRRKAGNRATNLLITNMAAADLLVTLFAMPYSVLFINVGQQWIGGVIGQVTCKFVHFAYQISIPASIFTVLLVSFDRYFAICYPMKANVFRNGKVMTTTIWISSAALTMRPDAGYFLSSRMPFTSPSLHICQTNSVCQKKSISAFSSIASCWRKHIPGLRLSRLC